MSYQAITDIIVNQSQVQDFQLSAAVKDSPNSSPSVSFADFLASYNTQENKSEIQKPAEAENVNASEKTVKTEKASEKVEKKKAKKAAAYQEKVEQCPRDYRPVKTGVFFWTEFLFAIPGIGLLFILLFSIFPINKNFKNYDWLIFNDIDEYIHLKYYSNIKLFLNKKTFSEFQLLII